MKTHQPLLVIPFVLFLLLLLGSLAANRGQAEAFSNPCSHVRPIASRSPYTPQHSTPTQHGNDFTCLCQECPTDCASEMYTCSGNASLNSLGTLRGHGQHCRSASNVATPLRLKAGTSATAA